MKGIVAFDLDGTLLRGRTVCEILATPCGRLAEVREFETTSSEAAIAAGRSAMAGWYRDVPMQTLLTALESAEWAPGAAQGVALLRSHGIEVVVASITWRFAVQWFAERLGIRRYLGTDLSSEGAVVDVWPRDKGRWLRDLALELSVPPGRLAAVGDSAGDIELLRAASFRVFVGHGVPAGISNIHHWPNEKIEVVAKRIIDAWAA